MLSSLVGEVRLVVCSGAFPVKPWLMKFSGAVLVSAVTAGTGLVAGILVLRLLPPADAGRYTLVTSIAGLIGVIGLFGQPNLVNRLYAQQHDPVSLAA